MPETRADTPWEKLRFELSSPRVAMQVIDGEAILIDFERGNYFSARGLGCALLRHFVLGFTLTELGESLEQRGRDREQLTLQASRYLRKLVDEELVAPSPDLAGPRGDVPDIPYEPPEVEEPELVKYTDLADLLLLDPIHDVDEQGWPPPERANATS